MASNTADRPFGGLAELFDGHVALVRGAEAQAGDAPGAVGDFFDVLAFEGIPRAPLGEGGVS
jgi:hypothetical protein